ncbi:hypothetical protein PVAND_015915 [Polypedilum vanderplanki]|uniref:Uncharacterized protein n=1 Tax=Polypedilum vanderplanki TaxID=319348 RepID=A0A9J6BDM1_POLVA|nr:hypothetical protein PVAND_015915 [Polypedilum vanderplanki]
MRTLTIILFVVICAIAMTIAAPQTQKPGNKATGSNQPKPQAKSTNAPSQRQNNGNGNGQGGQKSPKTPAPPVPTASSSKKPRFVAFRSKACIT